MPQLFIIHSGIHVLARKCIQNGRVVEPNASPAGKWWLSSNRPSASGLGLKNHHKKQKVITASRPQWDILTIFSALENTFGPQKS